MKNYIVIGNPINHSLSPKLHNFWFKSNNIKAFYDKQKLEENEIEEFILNISKLINEQKANTVIKHLSYDSLNKKYDNALFTSNAEKINFSIIAVQITK